MKMNKISIFFGKPTGDYEHFISVPLKWKLNEFSGYSDNKWSYPIQF